MALNPADISIENKSGPSFIIDETNPCDLAPGAAYMAFEICNLKGETLRELSASLSDFENGFGLAGGQISRQELGELDASECRMVYWYVGYPCDDALNPGMTIELKDDEPGTVNFTTEMGIESSKNTGIGATVNWASMGTSLTSNGELSMDVEYEFRNVQAGKVVYFQPASNIGFEAGCMQLARFNILDSEVAGISEGEGKGFYHTLPEDANGTNQIYVRYYFKVECQSFETEITPFATATSGNTQLEHQANNAGTSVEIPGDIELPCSFVPGAEFELLEMPSGNSWGMAWGDFDNDGHTDLFVTTNDIEQPNVLYQNDGNGTFSPVTSGEIATDQGPSLAAAWGDYDNDGDLDLYVTNNIGTPNFLYRNAGNGQFTRIQGDPAVTDLGYSHGAAWTDFDNDGFLDLFVATYWETEFNHLYRNNGDGTFSKMTNNPVVNEASRSVSGAWGDYDGDGLLDLFVANLENRNNSLYRNTGNGTFEKITTGAPVSDGGWSVGASWADFDNDGDLDLFVANASNQPNFLYENKGNGVFEKITEGEIVTDAAHSHGSAWADFDNDGDLDLFVANDGGHNAFYENNGDPAGGGQAGSFSRRENETTDDGGLSFGTAWADVDHDGDLDLFVANRNGESNFLYKNQKWDCHNFAAVRLVGTRSNRSAIGAKISLTADLNGTQITQTRLVSAQTGGGTGGQNELTAHFGLGEAHLVKEIKVEWPSGYVQTMTNKPVNQTFVIEEDEGSEINGYVYFAEGLDCSQREEDTSLPAGAENAFYRTVASGNWSDAATWLNGEVPYPFDALTANTISIEHDVVFDFSNADFKIEAGLTLWLSNAHLEVPFFDHRGGNFIMRNANLTVNAPIELSGSAHFSAEYSGVLINGDFQCQSDEIETNLKNTHFLVSGSMENKGVFNIEKSIIECESLSNFGGTDMAIHEVWIKSEEGLAQYGGSRTTGEDMVLWVIDEEGYFSNYGSGIWQVNVEKYCMAGFPSGISGQYLPTGKDCDIEPEFSAEAIEDMTMPPLVPIGFNGDQFGIPNTRLVISPGNLSVYTDEAGYYSATLPPGNYQIEVFPSENFSTVCPNEFGTIEVEIDQLGKVFEGHDFGHLPTCNLPDMEVEMAITAHRIGFENLMVINYQNAGAMEGNDAQLTLSLGEGIVPQSASVPWATATQNALTWQLGSLETGESGAIYLTYMVDANVPISTPITLQATIACTENDCDDSNDIFALTSDAVGGLDPNDILVQPEGGIFREEELSYKIRFQNVGNATVSSVRIEDALPEELDLATLEVGAASHPYEFRVEGRKLVWNFPHINLPDSLNHEPESHGFVTFRIRPKAGLAIGDHFGNEADIFFDHLEAVRTNTVANYILAEVQNGKPRSGLLHLMPNPTLGPVTALIQSEDVLAARHRLQTIEVFDQFGRLLMGQNQINDFRMHLDLSSLLPGIYTLKGVDETGKSYTGKVLLVEND